MEEDLPSAVSEDRNDTPPREEPPDDRENPEETVIKISPSDLEMSDSDDDDESVGYLPVKNEIDSEDYEDEESGSDHDQSDGDRSHSWKGSSEDDSKKVLEKNDKEEGRDRVSKTDKPTKRKSDCATEVKPKRPRGRPKHPRRIVAPDGAGEDYTSEEDVEGKTVFKTGMGYPAEFKLKVIKYGETHSNRATAEKFGIQPKRVREWKKAKQKIEDESKGSWKRRPRSDGYTVQDKLQAVQFAAERSTDEARLLYNVDRRTIEKWKAKKEQLEARLLNGEGDFIRRSGSGRKPKYGKLEEHLRDWVVALRLKGVTLNYQMILNKAKSLMTEHTELQDLPVPRTRTWVVAFLKRQNLHGLLGNTLGHEDPSELLNGELVSGEEAMKSLAETPVDIPENPNKRNRRTISLEDKVSIIRRIEQGQTQGTVAKSLKVATSTIQTIWSCRNEILQKYLSPKSKTKSDALIWKAYSAIGASLADWIEQNSSQIPKLDLSILMEKSIQLAETYRLSQFQSEAKHWLRVFCKRHNYTDILTELRANYGSTVPPNIQTPAFQPPEDDHQSTVDDYHSSEFNFNDSFHPVHTEQGRHPNNHPMIPNQSHGGQAYHLGSHQPQNTEGIQNSHPAYSVTPSPVPTSAVISSTDAVKYISMLRNWVNFNYGQNGDMLNDHLSVVENAVLKKRMTEMNPLPPVHHNHNSNTQ